MSPDTSLDDWLASARQIAGDVIGPRSAGWDERAAWPVEAFDALRDSGLTGLVVPATYGGLGGGLRATLEICEILGAADASVGLCFGMHCVASACMAAKAAPGPVHDYLEQIAAGDHLTTLALSESGSGSHFYLPSTTLEARGGRYEINGVKSFVTSGGHASSYVVSTASADAAAGHFSMVAVPADASGLAWGGPWEGWGMRANSSRDLTLDRVEVDRANLLGDEGDEIWYVFNVVAPYFLVAMAGTYLGVTSRAVELVREHLGRRHYTHSGSALIELPVLQHRLGTLWTALQRTRRLCQWAAGEADAGGDDALPALCAAKADVADTAVDVVNEAMTLCGGGAYRGHGPLTRLLRDARAAHVMAPTTDILYTWTGRALAGLPLLSE